MRRNDFFVEGGESDMFGVPTGVLDEDLVTRIHAGVSDRSDVEVSVPLARLLHEEFEKFGTGGGQELTSAQAQSAMRALRATVRRLGVEFTPPFADCDSFYSYWKKNGASGAGGWQARRDILSSLFDPLHDQLADIQAVAFRSDLAMPVGDRPRTGWTRVDAEVAELRRHFQAARTPQDYRNVGNDCVIVLERLSEAAYDPVRHLESGEEEPPVAKTKARLERVVAVEL